jgi:hypothetical protein
MFEVKRQLKTSNVKMRENLLAYCLCPPYFSIAANIYLEIAFNSASLYLLIFKNSVPTSKNTQLISVTNIRR